MTERAVQNARSLHGIALIPAFHELFGRGRYDVVQFARDFCDREPHDGQKLWLSENVWAPERVLACSNRWGKSTAASIKLRHHALYQTRPHKYRGLTHDYTACALSLTLDMARIVWDLCYYGGLAHPLYSRFIITEGENRSKLTPFPLMVIGDGQRGPGSFRSEIMARTTAREAQYLAGHSFDYVNWDEPSREPKGLHILDDILRMRLPDRDGRLDFTSTGNGKNWYYGLYEQHGRLARAGSKQHYSQTGEAFNNPHISHEAVRRALARMSPEMAKQNIYGGFADSGNVFPLDQVQQCYEGIDYKFPEEPGQDENARYVGAADFGRLQDKTVLLIARADCSPARIVYASEMGDESTWPQIFSAIAEAHRDYRRAPLIGDATSLGGDVILDTLSEKYKVRIRGHQVGGSKQRRNELILRGQRAIQGKEIVWRDGPGLTQLNDQLIYFSPESKNQDDDWVMAFCLLALQLDLVAQTPVARANVPFVFGGLTWPITVEGVKQPILW